jgi:hypothetical protein
MGAAQTREYVDRRYEDRDASEHGKRGGEALRKAFGVKTIRDLATNDFVLKAQEADPPGRGPGRHSDRHPRPGGRDWRRRGQPPGRSTPVGRP